MKPLEFRLAAAQGKLTAQDIKDYMVSNSIDEQDGTSLKTALHYAAEHNKADMVELLTENGASLNVQDAQGNTPLHLACLNGNRESLKALIRAGADVKTKNKKSQTALKFFNQKLNNLGPLDDTVVYQSLGQLLYDDSELHTIAKQNNIPKLQELLQLNSESNKINSRDGRGNTPLHIACLAQQYPVIEFLLQNGADCLSKNNNQQTPLMLHTLHRLGIRKQQSHENTGDMLKKISIEQSLERDPNLGKFPAISKSGKLTFHSNFANAKNASKSGVTNPTEKIAINNFRLFSSKGCNLEGLSTKLVALSAEPSASTSIDFPTSVTLSRSVNKQTAINEVQINRSMQIARFKSLIPLNLYCNVTDSVEYKYLWAMCELLLQAEKQADLDWPAGIKQIAETINSDIKVEKGFRNVINKLIGQLEELSPQDSFEPHSDKPIYN